MANPDTLVPQAHKLTLEEQSKGGKKSGEVRRQRKTLAQIGDMIGALDIKSPKNRAILRDAGITDEDMINDVGMLYRLNLKAQTGDPRAIELLAKLRGQMKDNDFFGGASVSSITINFGGKTVDGEEAK